MITVRLMGGLGNQLFQMAYALGLKSRGYDVGLDKSGLDGGIRNYELEGYHNLPLVGPSNKAVYEKGLEFNESALFPEDGSTMVGYWQSEKYFSNIVSDIRFNIHHGWSKKKLTGPAAEYSWQIYKSDSVFMHVRRGDYLNPGTQEYHGLVPIDYYKEAYTKLFAYRWAPKVFVFSDGPDWCEENFPGAFTIVRGTNHHEDLRLMASCKDSIIANSSFSWWGAWLGESVGSFTFAPKQWFLNPDAQAQSADRIPDRWTKI